MSDVSFYVLFDRVQVQAANAASSPITYGFPAVTGFLGAIHALSRKLPKDEVELQLDGVLIACHGYDVKRYRPHPYTDYTFNQSRNPIKKNGKTASIIEEAKIDITVSLLVEIRAEFEAQFWLDDEDNREALAQQLKPLLMQQRVAGGSVQAIANVEVIDATEADTPLKQRLLPAFVLMDASDELIAMTASLQETNPDATALDVLVETATLHHVPEDTGSKTTWKTESIKSGHGWLVPIPVGFQPLVDEFAQGALKDCRTTEYPSHYVECLYGLGKWVFPYSLETIAGSFWRYKQTEDNLFLISQALV